VRVNGFSQQTLIKSNVFVPRNLSRINILQTQIDDN